MYKVLIADDEYRIRKGLRHVINWNSYDMEVVGEAEDGEIALEKAKELQPDVMLLDICMPFLNGLDLIEQLEKELSHPCVIIIITGYDDFTYAQRALKLKVFDFLLKPVSAEQFKETILRVKEELIRKEHEVAYREITNDLLDSHEDMIIEQTFFKYIKGSLDQESFYSQIKYYGIHDKDVYDVLFIRVNEKVKTKADPVAWEVQLLNFAVRNIIDEVLLPQKVRVGFVDEKNTHLLLLGGLSQSKLNRKKDDIIEAIKLYLNHLAEGIIYRNQSMDCLPELYSKAYSHFSDKQKVVPVVQLALRYIHKHYLDEELSLNLLAKEFKMSTAYLSRLIKEETGKSFIDYVTMLKVNNAVEYMKDPTMKLYEVAERVGYNSQHYFSTAFKKVMGMSPLEYRKRLKV